MKNTFLKTLSIFFSLMMVISAFGTLTLFPTKVYAAATDTFTRASGTNANGYGTWVVPAGVTSADVACWGGGGAAFQGVVNGGGGAGGGGGAFASSTVSSLVEGTSYTIFVGLGGTTSGANGATSTFATTTVVASPGSGGEDSAALFGAGGLASLSTGTVKNNGGDGGIGVDGGTNKDRGGGGGGAAGPHGVGTVGSNAAGAVGGAGGSGDAGSGGAGGAGDGFAGTANANGGGGGGGSDNDSTGMVGGIPGGGGGGGNAGVGAGASGQCTVTYTVQVAPTVTTSAASAVTESTITLTSSGNITVDGGSNSTVRGFASSTSATLSTGVATSTESGSFGTGAFSSTMGGLTANMTYYWRAYATSPNGTGYGSIQSTSTLPAAPTSFVTNGNTTATTTGLTWVDTTGATTYKLQQCQASTCTIFSDISGLSTTTYALVGNTTYDYAVRGVNSSGLGAYSATSSMITLPDVPSTPTFSSTTSTSVLVSWNAPTGGASTYKLLWCTSGGSCTLSSGISGVSTSTVGLSANTAYTFKVLGTNATGDGMYTASSSLTTLTDPPGTPSYTATGATSTGITWTAAAGATSYKLEQCVTGSATCSLFTGISSNSTTTYALTGNTSYDYAVRATNAEGDSAWSATSTVLTVPNIPTTLTLTNTTATSTLASWNAPTGGASTYKLLWCTAGGVCSLSIGISGVSTTTVLSANTAYTFKVLGTNATGDGMYTASSSVTTYSEVPGTPTYVNTAATSTGITWTEPSGGATSYKLEQCVTGTATCSLFSGLASNSTTTYALVGNTSYDYAVRSTNAAGDSAFSATSTKLTVPNIPGTPTFTSVSYTSLTLSWTGSVGSSTSYKIERCSGGGCTNFAEIASGIGTTTYNDSGLAQTTEYRYQIRGTNATGDGLYSTSAATTTLTIFSPTVTTDAVSAIVATSSTLNANITATGGTNATARGFATSTNSTLSSGVSTSTENGDFGTGVFTGAVSGLTGNTTYYIRAYATNPTGTGYGSIESFLTPPNIPGTPTYSNTVATSTGVSWTSSVGSSTSYKIERCVTGSATCSLFSGHGTTSTTTINLTGNTSYDFAIRGTNATGDGLWSATSTVLTVPNIPGTPSFASVSYTSLTLSWTGSVGSSTSYKIERCSGGGCTNFAEIASGIGTTTYNDSGLTDNTIYRYQIRGTNATGDGLYSTIAATTTIAISPPIVTTDAINNSTVTQSTASLTASITSTGGSNATARGFATSTVSNLSSSVSTTTESGNFGSGSFSTTSTGLSANATYYYRAYATNSGGTGYGSIQSFLTLPTAPGAPSYGNQTATTTTVSWTNPTGATTYKLEQCINGTGTCSLFTGISGSPTTTYSLTGNTNYDYAVRGTNATGDSAFSATSTVLTRPDVPGTPTFASVSYTTLTVGWSAPTGGAVTYKVERCAGSGCTNFAQITGGLAAVSYDDTNLSPATEYLYRIRATNTSGDGLYSIAAATTTLVALSPTVTTSAASSIAATSTILNGDITDIGSVSPTARGYASSTDATLTTGVSTSTESGSFGTGVFTGSMGGLTGNTTYYFRAYATNIGGTGYGSIQSFLTTPNIPGTPTFANISQTTLVVNWSGSVGSSTSYKIERCQGSGCTNFAEIASGIGATTHSDSGLSSGTDYRYRVRGTNGTGDGLYSAAGGVTTTGNIVVTGGGYGGGGAIGGDAPAGQGIVGGGGSGAGESIGSDPNFFAPTANALVWGSGWTNAENAYTEDLAFATSDAVTASDFYGFGFSVPSSNTILGIAVKLLASGTTNAGSIGAELSWNDGSATTTSAFSTGALTTSNVLYTLGGATSLWGHAWTFGEFPTFRLRVTSAPSGNTVRLDAIQVRVYHQATGGGGGGGGEI